MPGSAEKPNRAGICHVLPKGISRQHICGDEGNFRLFPTVTRECGDISKFVLYTYCLMTNRTLYRSLGRNDDRSSVSRA